MDTINAGIQFVNQVLTNWTAQEYFSEAVVNLRRGIETVRPRSFSVPKTAVTYMLY